MHVKILIANKVNLFNNISEKADHFARVKKLPEAIKNTPWVNVGKAASKNEYERERLSTACCVLTYCVFIGSERLRGLTKWTKCTSRTTL